MVIYANGKIYKIVCNVTGLIYIGSTTKEYLSQRLAEHKKKFTWFMKDKEKRKSMTSFKIIENNNYEIVLIENFPCEIKDQLHARERFYIESMECVNLIIPTRSRKEWYDANKETLLKFKNIYRKSPFKRECGSFITTHSKARHMKSKKHNDLILVTHNT